MNNLLWSILANRIYAGDTWAVAKAFVLANYVPAADQTAAGVLMENNKTSGAAVATVGAQAPGVRTASWYVQGSPYATGYYSTANGGLPDSSGLAGDVLMADGLGYTSWATAASASLPSMTGHSGQFLTNNGTSTASWAAITAGGLLPAQSTHAGAFLTTDGTSTLSWGTSLTALLPAQSTHGEQFLSTDGSGTLSWAVGE